MAELTKLHSGSRKSVAVVFLHGLGGNKISTWRHESAAEEDCWPHWLGSDADVDVWTIGYDAELSGWTSQAMPLPDQAVQCTDLLLSEPRLGGKNLVLIGHSMGGLVAKALVINGLTKDDERSRDLAERVVGIVFVATPHAGAQLASIARNVGWLLRTNAQVGNLALHDAYLRSMQNQFRSLAMKHGIRVRAYAETQGVSIPKRWWSGLLSWLKISLSPSVMIVSQTSAEPGIPGASTVPMAGDHFSICKPGNRDQQIHKSILAFLTEFPEPVKALAPDVDAGHHGIDGGSNIRSLYGRLDSHRDRRLAPRDGIFCGRENEVDQVLRFLRGATGDSVVTAIVAGVGGIGKTEICKAALRVWLEENPGAFAYHLELPDHACVGDLLVSLRRALNLGMSDSIDDVIDAMPSGLYYIDNIEGLAESKEGRDALEMIKRRSGVKILASSRVSLTAIMGAPISIDVLSDEASLELFRRLWGGVGELPPDERLSEFLVGRLGSHALSIALVARLGDSFSYDDLVGRWLKFGASTVQDPQDSTQRGGSLSASLKLTTEVLSQHEGVLALWTAAALFSTGLREEDFQRIESLGGWRDARLWLIRHRILVSSDGAWRMLPPLARFALDAALKDEFGFKWDEASFPLKKMFSDSLDGMLRSEVNPGLSFQNSWLLKNFDVLQGVVRQEVASNDMNLKWIREVHEALSRSYMFSPLQSRDLLKLIIGVLPDSFSANKTMADLEALLGRPDVARNLYSSLLKMCESKKDFRGQAHTLQALGILEVRMGKPETGRVFLNDSLGIFSDENVRQGMANALQCLGDLEYMQGASNEALDFCSRALEIYKEVGDSLGQANTLQSLAGIFIRKGMVDEAREHLVQSLEIFEANQDRLGQANALQALGDLMGRVGRLNDARAYLERALAAYTEIHDGLGRANTLNSCGRIHIDLGEIPKAMDCFNESLSLYEVEMAPFGKANSLQAIGDALLIEGDFVEAKKSYEKALNIYESIRDFSGMAYTFSEISRCYRGMGLHAECEVAIVKSVELAEKSGYPDVVMYVASAKAEVMQDEKHLIG